jgi:hypothetical protein
MRSNYPKMFVFTKEREAGDAVLATAKWAPWEYSPIHRMTSQGPENIPLSTAWLVKALRIFPYPPHDWAGPWEYSPIHRMTGQDPENIPHSIRHVLCVCIQ